MDSETEITLARGDLRLVASPFGASLRGLSRQMPDSQAEPIITGYHGAAGKVGGQGDVLIPFPGRIAGGRYSFAGRAYQMETNDKDGPNAIHGFLRAQLWEPVDLTGDTVTFRADLSPTAHPGYPFSLRATITYQVEDAGMACRFAIENTGDTAAPVAAGFHPYFTVDSERIDEDWLQVPFAATLEFDSHLIPTGKILPVAGTPYDFRAPRPIGGTALNTCFVDPQRDPDGLLRVRLTSPSSRRAITVWMDTAFDYVVLYSGDPLPDSHRRRALAIEPMTAASDSFHHPAWGLRALPPHQSFSGSWGVAAHE